MRKRTKFQRELNPVVEMVKDLLAKMTDGKAVERIEAYRVLEGARMSLEFDNLDLDYSAGTPQQNAIYVS